LAEPKLSPHEPKLPTGYRQGLITAITVLLTASLLYFRFVAFEPSSGPWTGLGVACALLAGISIFIQFFTLWRALQPDDEKIRVYKVTLQWFAAAVLFLVGSFVAYIVASVIYEKPAIDWNQLVQRGPSPTLIRGPTNIVSVELRVCTHKSPSRVRIEANRTLSRHRRMTESDPTETSARNFCCDAQRHWSLTRLGHWVTGFG
jgi:hypothetical protein